MTDQSGPSVAGFRARLGKRLRDLRTGRGIRQCALARAVGLSAPSLSNVETGKQPLTVDRAARIASALGVSLGALVHGVEWESGDE